MAEHLPKDERFQVFVNDDDAGVFILDGINPVSSEKWLGVGFKLSSTKKTRVDYAKEICALLNRGAKKK